jgi:formate-dependent phosphoribosylglycinamide formyltransferase (GAR transformylase)
LEDSLAEILTLPLVVTARGILYGEIIGQRGNISWQPESFSDPQRQILYAAAREIVGSALKPGVKLLHFAVSPEALAFKSLNSFPDESALVTLSAQQPDLFTCHWRCFLGLPVVDLQIYRPSVAYFQSFEPLSPQVRQAALLEAGASLQIAGHLLQVQADSLCTAQQILHNILG